MQLGESDDKDEERNCDKKNDVLEAVRSIKTFMLKNFPKLLHASASAKAKNVTADLDLQRSLTSR